MFVTKILDASKEQILSCCVGGQRRGRGAYPKEKDARNSLSHSLSVYKLRGREWGLLFDGQGGERKARRRGEKEQYFAEAMIRQLNETGVNRRRRGREGCDLERRRRCMSSPLLSFFSTRCALREER